MSISYAVFCLNTTPPTELYTLSLHDALPISAVPTCLTRREAGSALPPTPSRRGKTCLPSTVPWPCSLPREPRAPGPTSWWRSGTPSADPSWRSEEHTSELQSHVNLVCRLLLEHHAAHRALHSFPTRRSSDLRGTDMPDSAGSWFSAPPDTIAPREDLPSFDGPVALLASARTAGAGADLLVAFRNAQRGPIVEIGRAHV